MNNVWWLLIGTVMCVSMLCLLAFNLNRGEAFQASFDAFVLAINLVCVGYRLVVLSERLGGRR